MAGLGVAHLFLQPFFRTFERRVEGTPIAPRWKPIRARTLALLLRADFVDV